MRKSVSFICPQCENPVRLKIGQVMIPHFAHIVLTNCLTSFSERESPTHLKGKLQLADFFQTKGIDVVVESYLPNIEQRPDLLVQHNQKRFAIEFQCSVIPILDVDKRSQGYLKTSIIPIWLLRTFDIPPTPKHGITSLQLSRFRQKFIEQHPIFGSYLITYNPTNEKFTYLSHLLHIRGNRFIGKVRTLPLQIQSFPFMQMKHLSDKDIMIYWQLVKQHRQLFLKNCIFTSKKGVNDPFLRTCYEFRVTPDSLPLFIGIPIEGSSCFSTSPVEWQVQFIYESLKNEQSLDNKNDYWIEAFVKGYTNILVVDKGIEVLNIYVNVLQTLNVKLDQFVLNQKIDEEEIVKCFKTLMVAKRCEY